MPRLKIIYQFRFIAVNIAMHFNHFKISHKLKSNAFGHVECGTQSPTYHFVDKNTLKLQNYVTCHTVLEKILSECM